MRCQKEDAPPPPYYAFEDKPQFPGSRSSFTTDLEFINPDSFAGVPVYRVMDRQGNIIDSGQDPQVGTKTGIRQLRIHLAWRLAHLCDENCLQYTL